MLLLSFAGFLRFDELVQIGACNVKILKEIEIPQSKCDIYQDGDYVVIKHVGRELCIAGAVERFLYISKVELSEYLFRAITIKNKHEN